jgi:hypothetical protein
MKRADSCLAVLDRLTSGAGVGVIAAIEEIDVLPSVEGVISSQSLKMIVSALSYQQVGRLVPDQGVGPSRACEVLDRAQTVRPEAGGNACGQVGVDRPTKPLNCVRALAAIV